MPVNCRFASALSIACLLIGCSDTESTPPLPSTEPGELSSQSTTSEPPGINAVLTRSPQGIPGDGQERRERVRGPRQEGRFEHRRHIRNREIRTYDGTGNNEQRPAWGATFSQLQRIANAGYTDGIAEPAGSSRLSARSISNSIAVQSSNETSPNEFNISDFGWQWGQFIDHDIDLTDGSSAEDADIMVPVGDSHFDPDGSGDVVIPMSRALYDPDTGTGRDNPRQQENEITAWLDGSMIYGSDRDRAAALREGVNSPYLLTSPGNLLPLNVDNLHNANGFVRDPRSLFLAGDIRVNEQVGLTALHTLFMREHNRLANQLTERHPDESADEIFERARRLVIATIQKITYEDYLPIILGENALPTYRGYDNSLNPAIFNEFSAAAFRLGHSMVNESLLRVDITGNESAEGPISLKEAFFTAPSLLTSASDIDAILRGLASQAHQKVDTKIIDTLRNFLFGNPGNGGFDLAALNIQRGRDHGLASYNDTRDAFGLERVQNVADITADIDLQGVLTDTYGHVDNIDLWVGGLAEDTVAIRGAQLGSLFHTIVRRQFTVLRDADRFWYQRTLTQEEDRLIANTTLADVIRNNTGVGDELQNNVFFIPRFDD